MDALHHPFSEVFMKYSLAVDIGASSGRHIVGWQENGGIRTEEVYRFPNGVVELDGHLTWDIAALESHVRAGIEEASSSSLSIRSISCTPTNWPGAWTGPAVSS